MDVSRALTARRLAEDLSRLSATAAALADEALWELSRQRGSVPAIADALGLSEASVRKAIQQHNRRKKGLPGRWRPPIKDSGE